jgi:hypothetical protein
MGRWRGRASTWALLLSLIVPIVTACGSDDETNEAAASTTTSAPSAASAGVGTHVFAGTLEAPPRTRGSTITAEQADGVSRSVVVAWMRDDRARAVKFVKSPELLDELFSRSAPSQRFLGGDDAEGYCTVDEDTGSYTSCSYSVADSSPDGLLALGTRLEIVEALILLADVGFVDWND